MILILSSFWCGVILKTKSGFARYAIINNLQISTAFKNNDLLFILHVHPGSAKGSALTLIKQLLFGTYSSMYYTNYRDVVVILVSPWQFSKEYYFQNYRTKLHTHTHYVKIRKCICFSRHRISMSVYIKKKSGKSGWLWEKTRELRTGLDIELLFYFVSIYFFYFCPMCMNFLLTIVTIIIILKCILSGLGCKEYEQEYDKLVS